MNNQGRKKLAAIIFELDALKERVETMAQGEHDKFENMSEGLQATAGGQLIDEIAGQLDACVEAIDTAIDEATNAEHNA